MKTIKLVCALSLAISTFGIQTSYAADGVQEVQTDAANSQKQALQHQAASPAPTPTVSPTAKAKSGAQQTSPNTNYQRQRDWRPKTVQTCVKGGITLQLKKNMACPRGFVKK